MSDTYKKLYDHDFYPNKNWDDEFNELDRPLGWTRDPENIIANAAREIYGEVYDPSWTGSPVRNQDDGSQPGIPGADIDPANPRADEIRKILLLKRLSMDLNIPMDDPVLSEILDQVVGQYELGEWDDAYSRSRRQSSWLADELRKRR